MITCPECGSKSLEGILFCEECGKYLLKGGTSTNVLATQQLGNIAQQSPAVQAVISTGTKIDKNTLFFLYFNDDKERVNITVDLEAILGRKDESANLFPDLDLTPYGALDKGVSRKHAVLRRNGDTLTVIDLGSANGTYLNGLKLAPNQPHVVRDGDEVRFGKLTSHIYFK
jgi:pSer/pThr/pTyr-binding forkhead associated (FHA) protein